MPWEKRFWFHRPLFYATSRCISSEPSLLLAHSSCSVATKTDANSKYGLTEVYCIGTRHPNSKTDCLSPWKQAYSVTLHIVTYCIVLCLHILLCWCKLEFNHSIWEVWQENTWLSMFFLTILFTSVIALRELCISTSRCLCTSMLLRSLSFTLWSSNQNLLTLLWTKSHPLVLFQLCSISMWVYN